MNTGDRPCTAVRSEMLIHRISGRKVLPSVYTVKMKPLWFWDAATDAAESCLRMMESAKPKTALNVNVPALPAEQLRIDGLDLRPLAHSAVL